MVGDGHAMGVAAQVLQHILRATEETFQIDHRVVPVQGSQSGSRDFGLRKKLQISRAAELAILESLLENVDELAAKNFLQHFLGKKVVVSSANPAGVIEGETAGRNDTMTVGMKFELLAPGVQHAEEANLSAEVSQIASDFQKGVGTGAEQEIVEDLLVLQSQWRQAAGGGEDHVQVAGREKFTSTRGGRSYALA